MLLNDAKVKRISDTSKLFQYFFSIKRNFFHFPYKMQKNQARYRNALGVES